MITGKPWLFSVESHDNELLKFTSKGTKVLKFLDHFTLDGYNNQLSQLLKTGEINTHWFKIKKIEQ